MYNLVLRHSITSAISVLVAVLAIFAYNWQQRIASLPVVVGMPNMVLLDSFHGTLDPQLMQFIADFDTLDLDAPETKANAAALARHFERLLPPPKGPLLKVALTTQAGRVIFSTHKDEWGRTGTIPVLARQVLDHGHPLERMIDEPRGPLVAHPAPRLPFFQRILT